LINNKKGNLVAFFHFIMYFLHKVESLFVALRLSVKLFHIAAGEFFALSAKGNAFFSAAGNGHTGVVIVGFSAAFTDINLIIPAIRTVNPAICN